MPKPITVVIALLLAAACDVASVPVEAPVPAPVLVEAQAPVPAPVPVGTTSGADVGPPEVVRAPVRAPRMLLHRNPRYIARCRRESRRDAPRAVTVEDRAEARRRALNLVRGGTLDEALLFARMAYGEEGPPYPGRNDDGYLAMLAVMDSLRGSRSRLLMFATYSPRRLYPHPGDVRQQWVAELQLDGRRPPSWPASRSRRFHAYPSWRAYGCPRWLATVDAVRALLRRRSEPVEAGPCAEVPDHWGGSMDTPRAKHAGWRAVDCRRTRNRFWVVPARAVTRLASAAVPAE